MELQEIIELASEQLGDAVRKAVQSVGHDVAMALLIHYLHEISITEHEEKVA